MKVSAKECLKEWTEALEKVALQGPGKEFIQNNPFKSFAPVREDERAYWFADGKAYMASVADVIERAQEEIFITDWWLSPEIYLKRGKAYGEEYRLDNLLKKKAVSTSSVVLKEKKITSMTSYVFLIYRFLPGCGSENFRPSLQRTSTCLGFGQPVF